MNSLTPSSRADLLSQLRADQSQRWQRGERVFVEHYLTQYPDLANNPEVLLDLIGAEMRHRQEHGEQPSLDDYLTRFPQQSEVLRRSWPWLRREQPLPRREESEARGGSTASKEDTIPHVRRETLPPKLPGFLLHERLGHGGMGEVYHAWDIGLGQPRAVKVILTHFSTEWAHERFQREAKASARLDHPGVVRIYALGEFGRDLFISMEYLEGGSLACRLEKGRLPFREAADLVRQLALAVQHAHDNKVLHRDLKPSNVLLTADGKPKVGDFGLAKLLDENNDLTRPGEVMGTPSYMAPEQAEGRLDAIDARTDVWALGAILYECLTGRPPFRGATRSLTIEMVKWQEPEKPRRFRAEIPAALEAICLKCLEKQSDRRYATAAELADDLQTWLDDKPVRARSSQRHRYWTAALAVVFVVGMGAAVFPKHKAVAPPVAPVVAEQKWESGIWNPLLTKEPRVLAWPKRDPNGFKVFLPKSREYDLFCPELGLIELGETRASRYQLAVTMSQFPWVGNIGLFFGYRKELDGGKPVTRYQVLTLLDPKSLDGTLRIDWYSITHNAPPSITTQIGSFLRASNPFPLLPGPHRLTVKVGPEGLETVILDNMDFSGQLNGVIPTGLPTPKPDEYKGKFGIYVYTGNGAFRDASYLFNEEP